MDGVMPQDYPPRLAKVRTNLPGKYLRVNVGRELGEMLENSDMVHQGCRMLDNGTLILVMVKAPRRVTPQKSMVRLACREVCQTWVEASVSIFALIHQTISK